MSYKKYVDENPLGMIEIPTDEIVIIPELSGRHEFARDKKRLADLAKSIESEGQLEPATCGLDADGNPVLYFGFGRYEACKSLGVPLLCQLTNKPIEEALFVGLHENTHREDLSAVQIAMNIKRLNEGGMKDSEIARKMGWSAGNVSNHKRLLAVDADGKPKFSRFALNAIHTRQIPGRAAFMLADLENAAEIDATVKELIETAKQNPLGAKTSGKVTADAVAKVVRKKAKKKTTKKGKEKATTKQRSIQEMKQLLETMALPGSSSTEAKLAKTLGKFIAGELDEDATLKAVTKVLTVVASMAA